MKRKVLFSLLLAGIVLCVFSQNARRISGVIRELTGEVELKRAGAPSFIRAKAGDAVAADTVISTGFKSTAIIELGNSTIAVRPLTRLSLAEIQSVSDTETVRVNLQTGRIRVDVKPTTGTRANFTVQSPSATASVRGTSFEFDTCSLKVNEGRVVFKGNRGIGILIPTGMASLVDADDKAVDPLAAEIPAKRKSLRRQPSTSSYDVGLTITW
ncbi:MAG: FecR family protein [Spirochaetaceae bacterium]|jgi:hypothetical protein|nr:FecR family protein [Spirochaetaceae bacterium]